MSKQVVCPLCDALIPGAAYTEEILPTTPPPPPPPDAWAGLSDPERYGVGKTLAAAMNAGRITGKQLEAALVRLGLPTT
jgi:hypothetical protein